MERKVFESDQNESDIEESDMETRIAYTIKLLLIALVIVFIITTVKAIISGIIKGITQARQILAGRSLEEIQREDKEKIERLKQKERIRFESPLYKLTHPLGYINTIIDDRIDDLAGKGNR